MDKYWVIYESDNDGVNWFRHEITITPFTEVVDAVSYIEEKLNRYSYCLENFKLIRGTELSLKSCVHRSKF